MFLVAWVIAFTKISLKTVSLWDVKKGSEKQNILNWIPEYTKVRDPWYSEPVSNGGNGEGGTDD